MPAQDLVSPRSGLRALVLWQGWHELAVRLISPLVLLLLWELASRTGWLPTRIIAAPSTIGGTLWQMLGSGELGRHLWVSLQRALGGLAIGISIGTVLALLSGLSRRGELVIDSPVQMLRTLPFLAIVPLFILWFGVGETPKIALIALGTTFPVYLTLFSGIRSLDPKLLEAATLLGLSRRERIWHVILPGALPAFFVGLRYAFGLSWLGLVVVEQINASAGIGYLVNDARDFMRTDVIVICLLIYSVLGLGIDSLVRLLERFALAWRPSFIRN
ncbi:ABC transporter permease [Pseudomonas gingeri]|uniref:ABC transporter permease n=2 Tax=Pseudomonas gingeri TaxID=117681 RepID=A0A7Y8CIC4_9PSED|nr:ABC transporter permease [Pseudomonas gingeri]NWB27072.1 ABC transporter permease [Pseudomonas gingeri]NWC32073.1 ABC transporter permease [Pseudomonas gingeri]NWD03473.1 ABC transporter permease [Pseudomonas gingeri]NWD52728.1 ABC transporter permease [Pseudomonas gingeri]NWE35906.1 ABC transporter permease [Pseudomonas gingeri]